MNAKKGLKLQVAISILVIFSLIISILVNWYSATNAMKKSLTEEYLENNYNYAKKLSLNTYNLLEIMQQNLNAAAQLVGNKGFTQKDLDTWKSANGLDFNSTFIVDQDGVIQRMSPSIIPAKGGVKIQAGQKISTDTMKLALSKREPFISKPYRGTSGRLVLLLSAPIFDQSGNYKGLIVGTIYLESENVLKSTLKNHGYDNGSYVYVVDHTGRIIYHPDASRINEVVTNNAVVDKIRQGESGKAQTTNSQGIEFFMGYAFEESTGWGIVSQTPVSVLQEPLHKLFKEMAFRSLPFLTILLIIAWLLVCSLVKPLNNLAEFSKHAITQKKVVSIENLQIHSSIYEFRELFYHIKNHIHLLNMHIQIDGLTEIANRRTFDSIIMEYVETRTPFSLILLDIDCFKLVNDTYGHLIGDDVLKYLSRIMESFCEEEDLCFRYGGEEFVILIKHKTESDTFHIAERLRIRIAETTSPTGKPITISLGVTSLQPEDQHPKTIIERADKALYQSKSDGRNRTTIYKYENRTQPA
ncbi:transmembrane protein [Peribacillus asahii]|uniref:Transmembrane protein n=1 Tax=Peribacillus asahii TaxID=228899 RepID=A0A3T0KR67_9BACI|nr:sensor domain-containing diguanylate cyclase [Peribacillus asahii]AZV42887.1 transmembrane protein [Peribacillus asahii]